MRPRKPMSNLLDNHLLIYILLFAGMIGFSLLTNALFLKFVRTLGIRKMDGDTIIRWGPQSKPAIGGLGFYILFLFAVAGNAVLFDPNQFFLNKEFTGLLLCTTMGFIIGLADDAYDTKPLLKLMGQILCGLILIATGNEIHLFQAAWMNHLMTILWVVGIMNSINMLDNMDAISSIVSIFILIACIWVMGQETDYIGNLYFMVILGGIASLLGFLWFNWHPSRMYMGDTGSQFLGALLSLISILYLWNYRLPAIGQTHDLLMISRNIVLVALAFTMTLADTTVVVVNRLIKGKSPFVGGKDHTTHHLALLGLSDRQVALVFILFSMISISLVLIIAHIGNAWSWLYTLVFGSYFLAIVAAFFTMTHLSSKRLSTDKIQETI